MHPSLSYSLGARCFGHSPVVARCAVVLLSALGAHWLEAAALSGRVHDEVGRPLAWASVSVHKLSGEPFDQTLQTNEHGIYSFAELPDGTYSIEGGLEGFVSTSVKPVRVFFPAEVHWTFILRVADLGTEGGVSVSSDLVGELKRGGKNVPNTRVCLTRSDGPGGPVCTVTNRLGQYFLAVTPGVYEVTINCRDFPETKKRLDMSTAGTYRNRITL